MRRRILWQHLKRLSWPEWRHQPWRNLVALLAVMLGVALAFPVHLINEAALSEFSAAVRNVNGQADFVLRVQREGFDESLYERVSQHPQVALASPGIDTETLAWVGDQRIALRVLGIDALVAPALNIELLPQPAPYADRLAMLHPDAVFLNPTARVQLKQADITDRPHTLQVQRGLGWIDLSVQGQISLSGEPTVVMDLAGVQTHFGRLGRLNHIDVRLQPGANKEQVLRELRLPPGVLAVSPQETAQRISNLSRAYRVNLTVLAEALVLGAVGSLLGLLAGTGLAQAALKLLPGDLGGGYFPGVTPPLRFSVMATALYGALGVAAALVGAWIPARQAQRLMPAQALKGLGHDSQHAGLPWAGPVLLALGAALAWAPPIGIPLSAYLAVACLLLGGIACVPAGVSLMLYITASPGVQTWLQHHPLMLLATSRARHQRHSATIAVAGVVASLALPVALTIMVASFRQAVTGWLNTVLPADLYLRTSLGGSNDNAFLPPDLAASVAKLKGVKRTEARRVISLQIDPHQPSVTLIAQPLDNPVQSLPLVGKLLPPMAGEVKVYVSEAMVSLYGARVGKAFTLPLTGHPALRVQMRGVWRDCARQNDSVMMERADLEALSGDQRVNDISVWLGAGTPLAEVKQRIREAVARQHPGS